MTSPASMPSQCSRQTLLKLGNIRKTFAELQSDSKRVTVLGEQKSILLGINASDTELAFGWKFTDLKQTITDLISQYIEFR